MGEDWVDDESLSREETLARFRALEPEPTTSRLEPARAVREQGLRTSSDEGFKIHRSHANSGHGVPTSAPR